MRTEIVIETAEELIRFARLSRSQEDQDPYIDPSEVTLIIDGGAPAFQGDNCRFRLDSDISESDILYAMAKECNISLYLT